MKKLFFLCMIVVAAAFASCSDDKGKGEGNGSIVGLWEIYQTYCASENSYEKPEGGHFYLEFREDGTGCNISPEGEESSNLQPFTYSVKGSTLYVSRDWGDYELKIEKLTATELVIIDKDEYDGHLDYTYMKRANR